MVEDGMVRKGVYVKWGDPGVGKRGPGESEPP